MFLEHAIQILSEQATSGDLRQKLDVLQKGKGKIEQDEILVLYYVFQANLFANAADNLNEKSTFFYDKALTKVLTINNKGLQVWVQTQIGYYYYRFFKYRLALPYFLKSSYSIDTNLEAVNLDRIEVLKKNAYFFMTTLDTQKSIVYLNKALEFAPKTSLDYAALLNAIGYCYFDTLNMKTALHYFNETKDYALANKDSLRYAKVLGDIGGVYMLQKQWELAENYLKQDIEISNHLGEDRNSMYAQIQLGILYSNSGKLNRARTIFLEAKHYAASKSYLDEYVLKIDNLLLPLALLNNDTNWELQLRREIDSLNTKVTKNGSSMTLDVIQATSEKEKAILEIENLKIEEEKQTYIKYALVASCGFLLLLYLLVRVLYKRRLKLQRIVYENKLLAFKLEEVDSKSKLKKANMSLESFKTYLLETNSQIDALQNEIDRLTLKSGVNNSNQKENLEGLLHSHLMTVDNWDLFKKAFIKDEPDFYAEVLNKYTDISESNLRIILLQHIGLSNSETAKVIGITIDGVKKAKQRLRKKYGDA